MRSVGEFLKNRGAIILPPPRCDCNLPRSSTVILSAVNVNGPFALPRKVDVILGAFQKTLAKDCGGNENEVVSVCIDSEFDCTFRDRMRRFGHGNEHGEADKFPRRFGAHCDARRTSFGKD